MEKKPGKFKIWLGIAVLFIGLAAFISFRVNYLQSHGQVVFWLAELFSPVAVFSVLLVTFVDKLIASPKNQKPYASKKIKK